MTKRQTRKSYKRKKIILGACLFASVALVSTGFAAWVIATQAETTQDGNISVGTVNDSSIEIKNVQLSKNSFVFEPKETDTTGRVRNDGTNFENLSVTVTGEISPAQYVTGATIEMTVPESVKAAAASELNYIVLPECVTTAQALTLNDKEGDTNVKTFSYEIAFTWGNAFNGKNPGEYFDTDDTGKNVSDANMKATLTSLHNTIQGDSEDLKFTITIKAQN